ncbi:hypothetical protein QUC31_014806 [Theobroma cacao]
MFNNFILIMEITAAYRCFLLLLLLCIVLNCRGCMDEERDALLQIKTSINSPDGTAFSSWYGEDCCQWEGVDCDDSTTRVSSILFHYQRDQSLLENWYPNATLFAEFRDLKELELPGNNIEGFTSPDDLSNNKLKGYLPDCLRGALSLTELILSDNYLQGDIPASLSNMTSLTLLDLS